MGKLSIDANARVSPSSFRFDIAGRASRISLGSIIHTAKKEQKKKHNFMLLSSILRPFRADIHVLLPGPEFHKSIS